MTSKIDPATKAKFWKDPKVPELLAKLAETRTAIPPSDWSHDACDHALRALAEAEGVKAGLLINAARGQLSAKRLRRRCSIPWSPSAGTVRCGSLRRAAPALSAA